MYMQKEFPGGPVVRTLYFHCQGLGSIPDLDPISYVAQKKKALKRNLSVEDIGKFSHVIIFPKIEQPQLGWAKENQVTAKVGLHLSL